MTWNLSNMPTETMHEALGERHRLMRAAAEGARPREQEHHRRVAEQLEKELARRHHEATTEPQEIK